MSAGRVSAPMRRAVASRAGRRCEYCLVREDDAHLGCQVDHVISKKHGGITAIENLAYACTFCNWHKGADIAALDEDGTLVPLFNPRLDVWSDHFRFDGLRILGQTPVGTLTAKLLKFNTTERVLERAMLTLPNDD